MNAVKTLHFVVNVWFIDAKLDYYGIIKPLCLRFKLTF